MATSPTTQQSLPSSPSTNADPRARAWLEYERGRGPAGTKVLLVEWEEDPATARAAGTVDRLLERQAQARPLAARRERVGERSPRGVVAYKRIGGVPGGVAFNNHRRGRRGRPRGRGAGRGAQGVLLPHGAPRRPRGRNPHAEPLPPMRRPRRTPSPCGRCVRSRRRSRSRERRRRTAARARCTRAGRRAASRASRARSPRRRAATARASRCRWRWARGTSSSATSASAPARGAGRRSGASAAAGLAVRPAGPGEAPPGPHSPLSPGGSRLGERLRGLKLQTGGAAAEDEVAVPLCRGQRERLAAAPSSAPAPASSSSPRPRPRACRRSARSWRGRARARRRGDAAPRKSRKTRGGGGGRGQAVRAAAVASKSRDDQEPVQLRGRGHEAVPVSAGSVMMTPGWHTRLRSQGKVCFGSCLNPRCS